MKDSATTERQKGATVEDDLLQLGEILGFMRVVWAVDHGLHSTSKRMSAALGVTGPQRLVIRIVGKFPGISAGRLADILHVHKSTLTGVLRRLEERGVLERKHDSTDGRRAVFDLTARGRELDAQRAGTVEAAVRRALARVPAEKILIAQAVLQVLATELESDG